MHFLQSKLLILLSYIVVQFFPKESVLYVGLNILLAVDETV